MIDFPSEKPSGRSRPPRVPFPSLHPSERMRGSGILDEFPAWECGQLLWESYRNVGDWAVRPRHRRGTPMFGSAAAEVRAGQLQRAHWLDPELRGPLEVIRDMLADPRGADAHALALACRRVSAWAGDHGKPATQFYFAAAAGLCVPEDARQAYHAGSLARDLAKWDAAEVWLEYAVAAARRRRDRETQAMAVLGIGNMFYRQGLYRRAREAQGAALVLARKHGLREMQGRTLHDLFVIAVELGEAAGAEKYAREALVAYGPGHPLVTALAHDVAQAWIARGLYRSALSVLSAMLHSVKGPGGIRVHVLAGIVRAAAGCDERRVFEEAWAEVCSIMGQGRSQAAAAAVFLELALGASSLCEWSLAEQAVASAVRVARDRGEVDIQQRAGALLDQLRARAVAAVASESPPARSADALVADLLSHLQASAAAS